MSDWLNENAFADSNSNDDFLNSIFDQSQGEQQAPQVAQVSTSMSNPPLQSQSALSTSRISQAHTPMYQQSPVTAHTIPQNSPQSMPNQVAQPQQQIPPPPLQHLQQTTAQMLPQQQQQQQIQLLHQVN